MKTTEHVKAYQPDEYQKAVSKDSLLFPLYRDLPGVVKKHISNLKADTELQVVDFGCGPGTSTPQLYTLFQGDKAKIVGVDRDASCIELAKATRPDLNYQQIDESKLTEGSIDIIFCIFVLLEKESQEIIVSLLVELHRALRKNGLLFVVNNNECLYNPDLTFLYEQNQVEANREVFQESRSGAKVSLCSSNEKGERVFFNDFFWTRKDYQDAAVTAGFQLEEEYIPKGLEQDGHDWQEGDKLGAYHIQVYRKC